MSLIEQRNHHGGTQKFYRFDNGYGASVICHEFSYGYESGLSELAVIKWDGVDDYALNYDTPITNDVIGHLTDAEVESILADIESLDSDGWYPLKVELKSQPIKKEKTMSNEKLVIFEDPYSDKLEVDFLSGCHVYISIETGAIYSQPVQLTPKDVKKLRKQLKKWLIENDYKDSKGE